MTRKEYNDRWNAPLIYPGVTMGDYEHHKALENTRYGCDGTSDLNGSECTQCVLEYTYERMKNENL